jgi:hypothetical protein
VSTTTIAIICSALVGLFLTSVAVYFVVRWRRMGRFGSYDIPCDKAIELPAGKVTLYYGDSRGVRYSEVFEPPSSFSVLVSDEESGERIDFGEPHSTISTKTGAGSSRIPYATLDLPRAGKYRLNARIHEGEEIISPRVSFG